VSKSTRIRLPVPLRTSATAAFEPSPPHPATATVDF